MALQKDEAKSRDSIRKLKEELKMQKQDNGNLVEQL